MNHLYPTTGIPTHAIHPFTRLPWPRAPAPFHRGMPAPNVHAFLAGG